MPTPAVSICMPAYKAERYLAETLASVRAQTFAEWDMIVTEDGSLYIPNLNQICLSLLAF